MMLMPIALLLLPFGPSAQDTGPAAQKPHVAVPGAAIAERPAARPRCEALGRVVDEHGDPLAGAAVEMYAVTPPWAEGEDVPRFMRGPYTHEGFETRTDAEGRFRFSMPLPTAGWVSLLVTPGDMRTMSTLDFGPESGREIVPLRPGVNDLGSLVCMPAGVIEGTVVMEDGSPAAGARVRTARWTSSRSHAIEGHQGAYTRTDERGLFRLAHVLPGERALSVRSNGSRPGDSRVMLVLPGAVVDCGQIRLEDAVLARGRVVDMHQQPLEGARITFGPFPQGQRGNGETDAQGEFEVALEQDGLHRVSIVLERYRSVKDQEVLCYPGAEEMLFTLAASRRQAFRVVDASTGVPLDSFRIGILPYMYSWTVISRLDRHEVADGVCTLDADLERGVVLVEASGYGPLEVSLATGNERVQELRLAPGGSLSGRVVDRAMAVAHLPVEIKRAATDPNFETDGFLLGDSDCDLSAFEGRVRHAETERDGSFRFDDLTGGTYRLTITRPNGPGLVRPRVQVEAGSGSDVGTLDIGRGATLVGHVKLAPGHQPAGLVVVLGDISAMEPVAATVAPDGSFRFEGLAQGEHRLSVLPREEAVAPGHSHEILLGHGEQRSVELDLTDFEPARVTVRVHRSGVPMGGVVLRSADGNGALLGTTGPSGRVPIQLLAEPHVQFLVQSPRHLLLGSSVSTDLQPGSTVELEVAIEAGTLDLLFPDTLVLNPDAHILVAVSSDVGRALISQRSLNEGGSFDGQRFPLGLVRAGECQIEAKFQVIDAGGRAHWIDLAGEALIPDGGQVTCVLRLASGDG